MKEIRGALGKRGKVLYFAGTEMHMVIKRIAI